MPISPTGGNFYVTDRSSRKTFIPPLMSNSPLSWLSEVFFFEVCLAPSESCLLSTSDSDWREPCRPVWLETLNRALFFLARSDSGADWLLSGSWFSGSEPTFTNAFLVLVRAEVTEPITKNKKRWKASVGIGCCEFHFTQSLLKLDSIFVLTRQIQLTKRWEKKTPTSVIHKQLACDFIFTEVNRQHDAAMIKQNSWNGSCRHLPRLVFPPTDTSHGESCSVDKHTDLSGQTGENNRH